jgi:hypothetical protein
MVRVMLVRMWVVMSVWMWIALVMGVLAMRMAGPVVRFGVMVSGTIRCFRPIC